MDRVVAINRDPDNTVIALIDGNISNMAKRATEYFCQDCLQLRLSFVKNYDRCANCNSKNIIIAEVGTLDKAELRRTMAEKKKTTSSSKGSTAVVVVDFTGVESGGGSVRVPAADYMLKCVDCIRKKSDADKDVIWFTFELSKGPKAGNGKKIRHSCSLQRQALWNLRNVLESFGITVPSKAVKIDPTKMKGKTCAGTVIDDEYEGRKRSTISAFFPKEDFGKTSESGDELEGEEGEESTEEVEGEEETTTEEEELF